MSYINWQLTDADGNKVFNTCFGCSEPGVQTLTKGGQYILTIGNDKDAATGTYQLQLFDVPAPNQFALKIGGAVKEGIPGAGAGVIESPALKMSINLAPPLGKEFTFGFGDKARGCPTSTGSWSMKMTWRCSTPASVAANREVQPLLKGGTYTLTVGNHKNPSTGTYHAQLYNVPPPNQFAIKIGDKIKVGCRCGAGVIETPGPRMFIRLLPNRGRKFLFDYWSTPKELTISIGAWRTAMAWNCSTNVWAVASRAFRP